MRDKRLSRITCSINSKSMLQLDIRFNRSFRKNLSSTHWISVTQEYCLALACFATTRAGQGFSMQEWWTLAQNVKS